MHPFRTRRRRLKMLDKGTLETSLRLVHTISTGTPMRQPGGRDDDANEVAINQP